MLKNKNILFSTDNILGYKESVNRNLNKFFNKVEYIEEYLPLKKERSIFFRILREITKKMSGNNIIKKYYTNLEKKYIVKELKKYDFKFDYFLVVAGREFSKEFLMILKELNPKIKCILFLWDSFEGTSLRKSSSEFDYIFSFDPEDCKKYGFKFRPSFYSELFLNSSEEKTIDLYYIGALREKKRYEIALKLYEYCKKNNLKSFIKIYVNKNNRKYLPEKYLKEVVTFEKLSYLENIEKTKKSKVILDINFHKQDGLTLRSIEGISTSSKIITTNSSIKDYDFYNPNNIFIINKIEEIENIPKSFFETKFKKIEDNIKNNYGTKGFLEYIFYIIEKEQFKVRC